MRVAIVSPERLKRVFTLLAVTICYRMMMLSEEYLVLLGGMRRGLRLKELFVMGVLLFCKPQMSCFILA
jgi:hypothetical protein